jgi:hypothetical protein
MLHLCYHRLLVPTTYLRHGYTHAVRFFLDLGPLLFTADSTLEECGCNDQWCSPNEAWCFRSRCQEVPDRYKLEAFFPEEKDHRVL